MVDVRELRHADTRGALFRSAIELFAERGFESVTVEEIAAASGVSRRTAYRRFRSKEDILLEVPRGWLRVFDAAVDGLVGPVAVRAGSLAVSGHIDDQTRDTLVALQALADAPGLDRASVAHDDWHERVVALLVADGMEAETAALSAGAYLGGVNAMLAIWADSGGQRSLVELNERLDDHLRPIW